MNQLKKLITLSLMVLFLNSRGNVEANSEEKDVYVVCPACHESIENNTFCPETASCFQLTWTHNNSHLTASLAFISRCPNCHSPWQPNSATFFPERYPDEATRCMRKQELYKKSLVDRPPCQATRYALLAGSCIGTLASITFFPFNDDSPEKWIALGSSASILCASVYYAFAND